MPRSRHPVKPVTCQSATMKEDTNEICINVPKFIMLLCIAQDVSGMEGQDIPAD